MACFGTGAFAVSQNESAYPTDKVVTLYSEENYEGQSKTFGVGDISLAGLYGSSPSGPQHKDELTSRYSFS